MEQRTKPAATNSFDRGSSLLDWSRKFLPHYFTLPPSGMHRWLGEQADKSRRNRGLKVNVIGPRGGAKSTVITLANVLRCALENWEPLIWIISETQDQAKKLLEHVKSELTPNELLAAAYPESYGRGPVWRSGAIKLRNNVAIEAYGVGQKIRGRREQASRPTLIVCDDLQDMPVTTSGERRKKDWDWFSGTLMKCGDKRTNVFNLATALHREAIGCKLDSLPGWDSRVFRSIIEWPADMGLWAQWGEIYHDVDDPQRREKADAFYQAHKLELHRDAVLLWPELEDLLTLMMMRENDGHSSFEREKQSRPINPEACEWPEEYFDDHIWFDEWPGNWECKVITLDPSKGKDARRSDYSAFAMLQLTGGVLYVDCDLQRRPISQIVTDGVSLYRKFRPDAFGTEANAFQELLGESFIAAFNGANEVVDPFLITNTSNKIVRIRNLSGWLAQRRIKFKRGSPGALLTVQQLKDFPDPHVHDDGPDAVEMGIRLMGDLTQTQSDGLGSRLPIG